jgi:phosphate starvation-inducible PhoH-like protein
MNLSRRDTRVRTKKRVLSFSGLDPLKLFGQREQNLLVLEEIYPGNVVVRGDEIILQGSEENLDFLTRLFNDLIEMVRKGKAITERDIRYLLSVERQEEHGSIDALEDEVIIFSKRGTPIKPKTFHQKEYVDAIARHDITISIGPAGTGKTFLAVASAVAALKRREIERIILVRPVVEAGESLGFLPGDYQAKLDPYVRPVVDALYEMLGPEKTVKLQENGTIEVAPLAYMRGRTLNNAHVILDEAQNTTVLQMKMFLTRLGANAKAIVNGDITQIDLDPPSRSGLIAAQKILSSVAGIKFIYLGVEDVIRHRLVQSIIDAFARSEQDRNNT